MSWRFNPYKLVRRPKTERLLGLPGKWTLVRDAVRKTLGTDFAVQVPLNGFARKRLSAGIAKGLRKQGLSFRSELDGDYLLCWVEEMDEAYTERGLRDRPRPREERA